MGTYEGFHCSTANSENARFCTLSKRLPLHSRPSERGHFDIIENQTSQLWRHLLFLTRTGSKQAMQLASFLVAPSNRSPDFCAQSALLPWFRLAFVTRVLNLLLSVDVIVYLFRFSHSSGSLKNAFETSHTQYEPRCVLPLPSLWGLCIHCNCAMHPHTFILSETQCHCPEAYSDSCAVFVWNKWAFVITGLDCIAS